MLKPGKRHEANRDRVYTNTFIACDDPDIGDTRGYIGDRLVKKDGS
jgi:hypothetical protein